MTRFVVHTPATAPAGSRAQLEDVERAYGFIPNLYGVFAESPTVLKAVGLMRGAFEEGTLSPLEQQLVMLAVSVKNACAFCVAAHSTVLARGFKLEHHDIDALRSGGALSNARLDVLAHFTRQVVAKRGWLPQIEVDEFLAAGFSQAQVLEVLLGVSMKTLHNYVDHIADTPLNDQFIPERWTAHPQLT
jgi:uncharacterized peroxidase-related enzyme